MTVKFCRTFNPFLTCRTSKGAWQICCFLGARERWRRSRDYSVNVSKTTKYRIPIPKSRDVQNVEALRASFPGSLSMSSSSVGELVASDAAFAHLANSTSNEFSDVGLHEEFHPYRRSKSRALSPRGRVLRVATPGRIERADSG